MTKKFTDLDMSNTGFGDRTIDAPEEKLIELTIDEIQPFALNPRRAENPEYADLLESIREKGLTQKFSVTKRPTDDFYTICSGGNTRLKILNQLWQETGDKRFFTIFCEYKPYINDFQLLGQHMIENVHRGEMIFIDKAMAAKTILDMIEAESGIEVTTRNAQELLLSKAGWKVSHTNVSLFLFAAQHLHNTIPILLNSGAGSAKIITLRKQYNALKKYLDHYDFDALSTEKGLELYFYHLARCDDTQDEFIISKALSEFADDLKNQIGIETNIFLNEIDFITEFKKVQNIEYEPPAHPTEYEETRPTPHESGNSDEITSGPEDDTSPPVSSLNPLNETIEAKTSPTTDITDDNYYYQRAKVIIHNLFSDNRLVDIFTFSDYKSLFLHVDIESLRLSIDDIEDYEFNEKLILAEFCDLYFGFASLQKFAPDAEIEAFKASIVLFREISSLITMEIAARANIMQALYPTPAAPDFTLTSALLSIKKNINELAQVNLDFRSHKSNKDAGHGNT